MFPKILLEISFCISKINFDSSLLTIVKIKLFIKKTITKKLAEIAINVYLL